MLKELKNVRQIDGEPRRRWFEDEYFDLIIWLEKDESVWGFQLCYDREHKPRALTWTKKSGYKHAGIDDGESAFGAAKGSPVLVEDGVLDADAVAKRFEKAAADMPHALAAFVLDRIKRHEFNA